MASLSTDALEAVQCRNTKFIFNDYTSDYKSRLLSLQLLPQMMLYELNDILFFVKSLRSLMLPLMFITVSHLVPQHPTTSLFTNLRELTSPRTLISINSLICGMLSPLSTSISVSHHISNYSCGIILSTTFDPNIIIIIIIMFSASSFRMIIAEENFKNTPLDHILQRLANSIVQAANT